MTKSSPLRIGLPVEPRRFRTLIGEMRRDATDGASTTRFSPAHGVPVSITPKGSAQEADSAVAGARCAFDHRRRPGLSWTQRVTVLLKAGHRQSGIGRKTGNYGVEEYTQIKSTHIELGERSRWVD
jgi:acyl-CoA reductase-like NAD-dependent aldehyde dehydrogenase